MKITLNQEKTSSTDVSIMVDNLRASTTITIALDYFDKIIPVFSPEKAKLKFNELNKEISDQNTKEQTKKKSTQRDNSKCNSINAINAINGINGSNNNVILAGERGGATLPDFDVGNSPIAIEEIGQKIEKSGIANNIKNKNYGENKNSEYDKNSGNNKNDISHRAILILTTSNGTRVLKNMNSTVLIGCMANTKSVAKLAIEKSRLNQSGNFKNSHIDLVMAGVNGDFAIEDFLACGEILFWINHFLKINENINNYEFSEYAQKAISDSRNSEYVDKLIKNSDSAKKLVKLGFKKDVDFCIKRNISNNVAIYENNIIKLVNRK